MQMHTDTIVARTEQPHLTPSCTVTHAHTITHTQTPRTDELGPKLFLDMNTAAVSSILPGGAGSARGHGCLAPLSSLAGTLCQNEMHESHGRPPASSPLVNFEKGPRNGHGFLSGAISTPAVTSCILGHQVAISPDTENFATNWMGQEVTGATLGIVGMGSISYKVAQRAKAFDMKILYHNRRCR